MNAIIIHGSYGHPDENWFPWLKQELEKLGIDVYIPKFPTPEKQSLGSWLEVFKRYDRYLDEGSIIIGHSLGPAFILSLLEKHKAKAAFLVSGFIGNISNPDFDRINRTFMKEFDFSRIKENCTYFLVYHSDDDPYVPLDKGKEIANMLGAKLKIIKNAGHFNEAAGYTKFELILEDIKKQIL